MRESSDIMAGTLPELNHREWTTLFAIAAGRAEVTCSCEPDLFIDGLAYCDQFTAHRLFRAGFVTAARPGHHGEHVRAELTDAGRTALAAQIPNRDAA